MSSPGLPLSPSRFIYERSASMAELRGEDTDLDSYPPSIPPSEDEPGTPEDYDRFSPAHGHDHARFAGPMTAEPYSRDVTPYERESEQSDTTTMSFRFTEDSVPENVAHALNNPGFRCLTTRQVHDICLEVSQDYIQNFRYNIEQRLPEPQGNVSGRFTDRVSIFDEMARSLYRSIHVTASLMANTTLICSIIWVRGNALQMLSPESVSRALDDMSAVNAAAEDIAAILGIASRRGDVQEADVRNALHAGMEYCERLGYLDNCEDLEGLALGFSVSTELGF
ncbi:hypothetical protein N0V84_007266 [Fusarium piperis]|uniref:Uncharacterized protein n=1 Tax=Fusarium piperis TaxID=1435070 RepID=A0A9W8WAG2_9HYPO|nr:hypothetical protein N0V84_007266 [Fusarium piperis]